MAEANKNLLDVARIFETFMAFAGDIGKCAIALNMPKETISSIANREHWADKIKDWNDLRSGSPGDVQVQINRAVNYVQAHRFRAFIDIVLSHLLTLDEAGVKDLLTKTTKDGSEFTTRAITDLVKAAEAAQLMTQRALGDNNASKPNDAKGSDMMLMVMKAMAAADELGLDSVGIVKKQLHN